MTTTGSDQPRMESFVSCPEVEIDQDDICPICTLLIYDPVTTICKHTLCQSCMVNWADTSPRSAEAPEVLPPKEYVDPSELSATCPMCRTKTTASSDAERAASLSAKYPELYAQRRSEELLGINPDLQYLNLYIGNKHQMRVVEATKPPACASSSTSSSRGEYPTAMGTSAEIEKAHSRHEWTFFVRTSRDDVIHSVYVHLHPAFSPSHHLINNPPFEVRNMGCKGPFCVSATVALKKGWVWVNSDADNFERKKFLRLHWTLDLGADQQWGDVGSMHRHRLKFRPEKPEDRTEMAPEGAHDHEHDHVEHAQGRTITFESTEAEVEDREIDEEEDYNDADSSAMDEHDDDYDSIMEDVESSEDYDSDYDDDDDDDNMSTSDDHSSDEGATMMTDAEGPHCAEVERRILAEL